MTFAISGSTIVQSGTDTSLTGLANVAGVQVTSVGTGVEGFITYNLGDLQLRITGTLSHNPDKEILITDCSNVGGCIVVDGIYNYGQQYIGNGKIGYSTNTGIVGTKQGSSFWKEPILLVTTVGTLNRNGGVIRTAKPVIFKDGATANINSGELFNINEINRIQLRVESGSDANNQKIQVNGLTLSGETNGVSIFTTNGFGNMVVNFRLGGFQSYVRGQPPVTILDANVDSNRVSTPMYMNNNAESDIIPTKRVNPSSLVRAISNKDTIKRGLSIACRNMELTYLDFDGNPANDIVYYATDRDSGNRRAINSIIYDTQTYAGTTTGNVAVLDEVIINVQTLRYGEVYATSDERRETPGVMPLSSVGYLYAIAHTNIPLYGNGTLKQEISLLPDLMITEQNPDNLNYTEIVTSSQFYDVAKKYLVDNYKGESKQIVTLGGDIIDAGDYSVTIDPLAADLFAFDGNTITIRSNEYVGGLKTNGVIDKINGATSTGILVDARYDSNITLTVPSGYEEDIQAYMTKEDAENQTNMVLEGHYFRYKQSIMGGVEIWFRMTALDGSYIIENQLIPPDVGEHNINLVVTSENAALGNIERIVRAMKPVLDETKDWSKIAATQRLN